MPATYDLQFFLGDGNDEVDQYGFGSQTSSHDDTFSFSISSAPEPFAWALMIAGLSVAGLALRRRPDAALVTIV